MIFPKLCTVIELVETIKKISVICDPTHSFSYRMYGIIWPNWPMRGFSAIIPITGEANHVKFETLCRIARRIKTPKKFRNRSRGSSLRGTTKKLKFLIFWGRIPTPLRRLRWNFAQPSGQTWPSVLPSLMWIGASNRPWGKTWFLACE